MINELLFVYGSLLNADNEFGRYLKNNGSFYSAGKFGGLLYDTGEYPAAITDHNSKNKIHGAIYQLTEPERALVILDDYEGFGTDQEQPNIFIRELLPVETPEGMVNCWIYLYNLPVNGLGQISSGNYLMHLSAKI